MSIDELKALCDQLETARKLLAEHEKRLSLCQLSGHQEAISVSVGGIGSVALTSMDRGYMQRLIRGREMIMLGVKKCLAELVEAQRAKVRELESAIAESRVDP